MRYEKQQQIIRQQINALIKATGSKGASINRLAYEMSLNYPVSPLMVRKQIYLMQEAGVVEIKEDVVKWLNL